MAGMNEILMTRKEAAVYMGISVSTLDRILRSGQMDYIQRMPNGKIWVSENAIREYMARITKRVRVMEHRETYRKRRVRAVN